MPSPLDLLDRWSGLPECSGLVDAVRRGERELAVSGLPAQAAVGLGLALGRATGRPVVLVTADGASAQSAAETASVWMDAPCLLFPPREFLPYAVMAQGPEVHARRLRVLAELVAGGGSPPVLSLPVTALRRQLAPVALFRSALRTVECGMALDPGKLARALAEAGYERQVVVEGPGSFAVRGGIVDVYPLTAEHPVRVECGDETVLSLRAFSADNQRSLEALETVLIPPAREVPAPRAERRDQALGRIAESLAAQRERLQGEQDAGGRLEAQVREDLQALAAGTAPGLWENYLPFVDAGHSVLDYLRERWPRPLLLVLDAGAATDALVALQRHEQTRLAGFLAEGRILPEQAEAFGLPGDWLHDVGQGAVVYVDNLGRSLTGVHPQEHFAVTARGAPPFGGQWQLALDGLRRWCRGQYRTVCWVSSAERAQWLVDQLREADITAVRHLSSEDPMPPGGVAVRVGHLPTGWEIPGIGLAALGEADLLGSRRRPSRVRRTPAGGRLDGYEDLAVGDFVVHATHGIGQYLGTQSLVVQNKTRDYLVLRYDGTDRLYVPTDQIALVQKYIGGEGRQPRVSRLGGAEWARTKQRVRESVRRMAEDLLALYAARQTLQGHAFPPDDVLQREFEDAFAYEETVDQLQASAEIKADMERPIPMDRLLCGDVGYGKTEVAMRAAFKAVSGGRQVVVLVPTTILAEQHYLTFTERFGQFPVTVRMLSRFRNRREQEETITALRRGAVDIVIGTHRLLQEDVSFKDLGLVIIDEEHRFGVAQKERLKHLRQTVDVLSMTATPIPRTLHMAMAGVRDMSVITTPPENRYPVETMVLEWSPALVREALTRELGRKGQVYYLHNRVRSIGEALDRLRHLVPDADVIAAHGQMPEEQLEQVMAEFWRGEHQILLATTIIESGLDIPNANTVIVEDSDRLGLAQLYQIRGRVGRSSRVDYAYFTYRRERNLSEVAQKRLEAIREFTELGSGFKIALRDLEIRGAGNILGPEQHGFVAAVGFDLYAQLLEEAVRELRHERQAPATRPSVELRVDAFIEDAYIAEPRLKLECYKRVHAANSVQDLAAVEEELRDRFGPYPPGVANLLRLGAITTQAQTLGLLGVIQEGRAVLFTFPNYAQAVLAGWRGPGGSAGRGLRVRSHPKPVVELALDGTDDATVLASVEGCLGALLADPTLRAWRQSLGDGAHTEEVDGAALGMVRQAVPPPVLPAPAASRPVTEEPPRRTRPPAAVAARTQQLERDVPDRLAARLGLQRVGSARPQTDPPAGKTLRPRPPAGLVLPSGGAPAGAKRPQR